MEKSTKDKMSLLLNFEMATFCHEHGLTDETLTCYGQDNCRRTLKVNFKADDNRKLRNLLSERKLVS